jgi:UTP--glucose-1-phosphate uridylyltransferase
VEIKKAIITAAGKSQRTLPLQSLVDRDGITKTALTILVEEILKAGIQEICIVIAPGDEQAYRLAAGEHGRRLQFAEQAAPLGYGNAVFTARDFAAAEPFLLLVGDHLYVDHGAKNCAQQLVEIAAAEKCSVSAVQATHESKLPFYGTVGGRLVPGGKGLYQVETVIEKPTPTEAEQKLMVPGLRTAFYLCFFGMHVFTPLLMEILAERVTGHLTPSLALLAKRERYLAAELEGRRYDIGVKYGLLTAQLALALEGTDRTEVLANLVELLAARAR